MVPGPEAVFFDVDFIPGVINTGEINRLIHANAGGSYLPVDLREHIGEIEIEGKTQSPAPVHVHRHTRFGRALAVCQGVDVDVAVRRDDHILPHQGFRHRLGVGDADRQSHIVGVRRSAYLCRNIRRVTRRSRTDGVHIALDGHVALRGDGGIAGQVDLGVALCLAVGKSQMVEEPFLCWI